ncbi:MAG TPA: serine O-acetyltransferase EpsC [Clostridia bacterium]|jgi:serine O-acetyltransferase
MFRGLLSDARSIAKRDPAAKSTLEVILLYPGFHVLISHRIAHWLYRKKVFFLARLVSQFARCVTGIEIHPGAEIGRGLFIDHGMGIVIGETAVVGDNCTIYHGVTLGGTGKEKGKKRHPTVGNNVLIGAGAKLLGPITVGDNAMIGSGSVVLNDVPPNSTVAGIKARVVRQDGRKLAPSIELDQINIPDPVAQELCKIIERIERLEAAAEGRPAAAIDRQVCTERLRRQDAVARSQDSGTESRDAGAVNQDSGADAPYTGVKPQDD